MRSAYIFRHRAVGWLGLAAGLVPVRLLGSTARSGDAFANQGRVISRRSVRFHRYTREDAGLACWGWCLVVVGIA